MQYLSIFTRILQYLHCVVVVGVGGTGFCRVRDVPPTILQAVLGVDTLRLQLPSIVASRAFVVLTVGAVVGRGGAPSLVGGA